MAKQLLSDWAKTVKDDKQVQVYTSLNKTWKSCKNAKALIKALNDRKRIATTYILEPRIHKVFDTPDSYEVYLA